MALGCHLKTQIMGPRGGSSGGSSGAGVPSRSTQTEEKDGEEEERNGEEGTTDVTNMNDFFCICD